MSQSKRKFRGSDRAQSFFRAQREIDEAEFKAIAARYHNEIITLGDGSTVSVFGEAEKAKPEPKAPLMPKRPRNGDEDAELDFIFASQREIVEDAEMAAQGEREAKQALRDRGVTFTKEPKSIHSKVPQGRISSQPKPKAPPKKPDGSGGKVQLWPGNGMKALNPYIHRHYGTGSK